MGTLQVGGTTLGVKNTVTNKVDLSNTGTLDSVPFFVCRAWVNFDGVDTSSANPLSFTNTNATNHGDSNSAGETLCAIRGSGNVSKVVRNGTGDYTITFTTNMPDANYCVVGSAGGNCLGVSAQPPGSGNSASIGQIRVTTGTSSATFDPTFVHFAFFR